MSSFWAVIAIGGMLSLVAALIVTIFTLAFKLGDTIEELTGKQWLGFLSYFASLPLMFSIAVASVAEIVMRFC